MNTAAEPHCLITRWNLAHGLLYAVIGFFAPDLFWYAMLVSVGWELIERTDRLQCQDATDLLWNLFGFVVGSTLRKAVSKPRGTDGVV